ncbi:MAG: UDP-N-acetylmuramoyl-L-alanine--D-glutamate ligase, partial [Bdellovibrionales bacterium]|nr:UDP-N-acetylmuramoyl-L-alanine--D-glutamate ligase [Bdellovibrionales bacterium]
IPSSIITGSNGKTTTSTLTHTLLESHGVRSLLVGNIGTPLISLLQADGTLRVGNTEIIVVEISSFQIETTSRLSPRSAAFLNCSPNHLDRHGTFERYFSIKSRLITGLAEQARAILNRDSDLVFSLRKQTAAEVLSFGVSPLNGFGAQLIYGNTQDLPTLEIRLPEGSLSYELRNSPLVGTHNALNLSASLLLCSTFAPLRESAIDAALTNFTPPPFRFEVSQLGSLTVVNDSKSTTVASTMAAVRSFRESFKGLPFTLLIGGIDKGGDWETLAKALLECSSYSIICFGRDRAILLSQLRSAGISELRESPSLRHALEGLPLKIGEPQGLLFSPGCSSFDEFRNFEERGFMFKSLVEAKASV